MAPATSDGCSTNSPAIPTFTCASSPSSPTNGLLWTYHALTAGAVDDPDETSGVMCEDLDPTVRAIRQAECAPVAGGADFHDWAAPRVDQSEKHRLRVAFCIDCG